MITTAALERPTNSCSLKVLIKGTHKALFWAGYFAASQGFIFLPYLNLMKNVFINTI